MSSSTRSNKANKVVSDVSESKSTSDNKSTGNANTRKSRRTLFSYLDTTTTKKDDNENDDYIIKVEDDEKNNDDDDDDGDNGVATTMMTTNATTDAVAATPSRTVSSKIAAITPGSASSIVVARNNNKKRKQQQQQENISISKYFSNKQTLPSLSVVTPSITSSTLVSTPDTTISESITHKRRKESNDNNIESVIKRPSTKSLFGNETKITQVENLQPIEEEEQQEHSLLPPVSNDYYIPTYIHKNIDYIRSGGNTTTNEITNTVYKYIVQHYIIPSNIEHNRSQYGPLSGTTYKDLIISAYTLNKLQPKNSTSKTSVTVGTPKMICIECATIGHSRDDCPTLV